MKYLRVLVCFLIVNSLQAQTDTLLFKSSFDNIIIDKTVGWNHHLSGTDAVTGYTFPDDLPGDPIEHYFNYVINDYDNHLEFVDTDIVSTVGADGETTNALYIEFKKDDPDHGAYSRVQYAMFGDSTSSDPVQRMNKGYVKYKIKINFDHDDDISDWWLPVEWKDMDDDGFRVGFYVYDTNTDSPYWVAKGQYMIDGGLGDDVWQFDNYDIPVLEDEWFELEVYWYGHPDPAIGKLRVAINGEVLFDITNQTKDPNLADKMFYFMPFKVYGAIGHSWITDFEYWSGPPANSVITDVSDTQEAVGFTIFPNPATAKINISSDFLTMNYEIITTTGQVVKSGKLENQEVDLSGIASGVYFLIMKDERFVDRGVGRFSISK